MRWALCEGEPVFSGWSRPGAAGLALPPHEQTLSALWVAKILKVWGYMLPDPASPGA